MRLAKAQRQHRIAKILEEHAVTSQTHLAQLLADDGVLVTQATLSRDLEEMGAVKVRMPGGQSAYAVPELAHERVAPEEHLRRVLSDWVVQVSYSGNLVVIHTPPGCAHVVASALDRSGLDGVLGTVAGDDTLMVVATDRVGAPDVASKISSLAGL